MERRVTYGSIKEESLLTILSKNKKYALLTKDFINICKDCEFRYACFDCRPDSLNEDFYGKTWYCSYNPYTGKWEDFCQFLENIKIRKRGGEDGNNLFDQQK